VTRHVRQRFKVKRSKVKVTRERDVSADYNTIDRQSMVISTSNLMGIIDVAVDACVILSKSVNQKTGHVPQLFKVKRSKVKVT